MFETCAKATRFLNEKHLIKIAGLGFSSLCMMKKNTCKNGPE